MDKFNFTEVEASLPVRTLEQDVCHYMLSRPREMPPKHFYDKEGSRLFDQICDCLLYTSPSPRDRQKSRMPSSA